MAAAALATVTPEDGTVAYPLVEFALQTNGIIEPSPHLLVVWGRLYGSNAGILQALEPSIARIIRTEDITRIGVGAVVRGRFGYGALVVALLSSHVRTAPIPRAIAADGAVDLELGLAPRLSDPRVTVRRPDGGVDVIAPVAKDAGTFTVRVECRGVGQMVIELGARNAASFAKFPVWCGMEAPRTFTLTPYIDDVPARSADAERKIMDLVNTERRAMGRQPLAWDEALATSARDHSEAMRRSGVVAATTPDGVSLGQRVKANRPDLDLAVAVARAYTVAEAHKGVIELPSTRGPLVSSTATMIGIGIAYGQIVAGGVRELFVTTIVAAPNDPWR